jgi:capsular polysaccharide biosynthesis protein
LTQHPYDDEMDLRDIILVIWRGRWWIILAVIVAALAAFVYGTFLKDPVYEAQVTFLAPDFRLADGRTLSQNDYLPLFRKDTIAEELVHKYGLASSSTEAAVESLLSNIEAKALSGSSAIVVTLRHQDRVVATDMLLDYAKLVQSEVASLANGINTDYMQRIEATAKARKAEYQTALDNQKTFEQSFDLNGLKATLLDRQTRLRASEARADELRSTIESLRASLMQAQNELDAIERVIVTRDLLDETGLKLLGELGQRSVSSTPSIEHEQINPAYTLLTEAVITQRQQLESAQAELGVLAERQSALKAEIAGLQQVIAECTKTDAEIKLAVQHALSACEDTDTAYRQASDIVSHSTYAVTVASGPWASTSPVGTGRLMAMALAVVLAGFVSVFGLLFADFMRSGERRAEGIGGPIQG